MLPAPDAISEDVFVRSLDGAGSEELLEVVHAAVHARRPQLAGRVAQLLDEDVELDPEVLRALRAARLFLFTRQRPDEVSWAELDDAMVALRRAWMNRARDRTRHGLRAEAGDMLGLGSRVRSRRR